MVLKKIRQSIGNICGIDIGRPKIKSEILQEESDISSTPTYISIQNKSYKKELYIKDKIERVTISDIKNWIPKMNIDGYRLFESRKEAREFGERIYGKWSRNLVHTYKTLYSSTHKLNPYEALVNYAGNIFIGINTYLRIGHSSVADYLNDHIKNIDIAFSVVPELDESIIAFRSIYLSGELMDFYQSLEYGDIITDKAYMSTSLILDVAIERVNFITHKNAILVIKIPKGEKCIFIDEVDFYSEYEMLINKNRMLKVEKILVKNDEQVVLLCELQSEF